MGYNKAQVQGWIRSLHEGELPFDGALGEDSYLARVAGEGTSLQQQLRAAFELREAGTIDPSTYQSFRALVEEEYNVAPALTPGDATPTFSPWAPAVQSHPMPEGWEFDSRGVLVCVDQKRSTMTGTVAAAATIKKGRTQDPIRHKSGRFLPHTAEVWGFVDGHLKRQVFVSAQGAIAKAWARVRFLQGNRRNPVAWIKFRLGESRGNRWIIMADAKGRVITPQKVVELSAAAKAAGIKAVVGERLFRTSPKVIQRMLEYNTELRATGLDLRGVDIPTVEPPDRNQIDYSIRFQSGDTRVVRIEPLSDDTENGQVVLTGHRKRAYRLLLTTVSSGSDSPSTVQYVYGKKEEDIPTVHTVGRGQALAWSEVEEEDEELEALRLSLDEGEIDVEEYVILRGRRLAEIDPAPPKRGGPAMHNPPTKVEYVNGRHFWGRAKNSSTPGSRWVGGQGFLEAQIYNM